MSGLEPLYNPAMLRWARETARFSLGEASSALGMTTESLEDMELGLSNVSVAWLRDMAALYKRSLSVFYLTTIPDSGCEHCAEWRDEYFALLAKVRRGEA